MCIRIGNHEYDPNYFTQSFINHSLSMTEGNLVTSPFGVFFMLCALLGSGGPRKNTSLEIGNAVLGKYVHHHNDNNDWESIASDTLWLYRSTLDSLSAEMTYVDNEWSQVITLANGIYASDDLQINGDFEQLLTEYFDENIHRVNFTDQSTAMQTINQWISSKTNNLISQFFNHPHEILPNSLLNLFSIFYFKDVWEVQFMEMFTENATFEVSSDRQIQVPIMFNEEELGYADFKSEGFEMIRITHNHQLYVNKFMQTNLLKLNENGIEATAVTSPIFVPISAILPDIDFNVNHPFICFIYDQQLTMPIIAAKIIEPIISS
ncbi:unnamed protein product [Schistosoma rodhaini]|uniref:Serpin domain-containing protein n=1 Tax=Schistosoma rodhaini TaxID=6188 RepID=A0AA85G2L3_9TREM|nr:unnamed protein product [Schistosoma rodhaini]CAH8603450.1 unnamed protein product [Schistosoma rodhaini]